MCKTPAEIIGGSPELDPVCVTGTLINGKIDQTMTDWSEAIMSWVGDALATVLKALTTAWIHIGTPALTNGSPTLNNPSATVSFLQNSLVAVTGLVLVISLMLSMAKMVLHNKAEAGTEAFNGMMRWMVVSGAGVGVVGIYIAITDALSIWILDQATAGGDLGKAIGEQLTDSGGTVFILYVLFGGLGILGTGGQIVLLIVRGGVLVALVGSLGFQAAVATTEAGKATLYRTMGWIGAWGAYKLGGAFLYGTGFKLMAAPEFGFDDTKTIDHLAGLALIGMAIIALPAMLRLVSPMAEAMAGGRGLGGILAGAAAIAIPTGAMAAKAAAGAASSAGGSGGSSGGSTGGSTGGGSPTGSPSPSGGGAPTPTPAASGSGGDSSGGSDEPPWLPTPPGFRWGGTSTSPA
jgi:type IV secretion system protein TrbL